MVSVVVSGCVVCVYDSTWLDYYLILSFCFSGTYLGEYLSDREALLLQFKRKGGLLTLSLVFLGQLYE